ncbi:MAG: triose-phosphate isomerase, partial [Proteobacteria bacterium]|nr:triose-phosphate isomerase [Pseudomonadota bacterium]
MVKKYVIGNWKCNKGATEAKSWFSEFARRYRPVEGLTVIVAPSFICLQSLSQYVYALGLENVSLAAQDISPFPKGSYTGAVAADMVKDMVDPRRQWEPSPHPPPRPSSWQHPARSHGNI